MLRLKSILTLALTLGGFQVSAAVFKGKVTLEDLAVVSEEAISAEELGQLLGQGKNNNMNHPDWVTDGNHPNWLTNANHPDWVTSGNHPDWLTAGNHPNWYTNGRTADGDGAQGELPSPTMGLRK